MTVVIKKSDLMPSLFIWCPYFFCRLSSRIVHCLLWPKIRRKDCRHLCYLPHTMLIREEALRHWMDHFYGYGSWEAKVWFVAFEDGGGDLPEEVAEKLGYFCQVHPSVHEPTLCDIRDLYRHASIFWEAAGNFSTLFDYRFGNQSVLSPVWKNLIAFEHGYQNTPLPDFTEYQRNTFGVKEALIKLYPLPSPHNHSWYYSWLEAPQFPFLKSREAYEAQLYRRRMSAILQKMEAHKPRLVLMYGMSDINTLKKTVQEFFPAANFKMVKAVKQVVPQHHRADFSGTTLLITTQIPTLRHNRIETGFDWHAFGELVRQRQA